MATKFSRGLLLQGLLLTLMSFCISSCSWLFGDKKDNPTRKEPVSELHWNVVFSDSSTAADRAATIRAIEDSVKRFYQQFSDKHPAFHYNICPCDSLLIEININILNGAGQSVSAPPAPPPGPAGKGDYAQVQILANNSKMTSMEPDTGSIVHTYRLPVRARSINDSAILAIIDTGIDTGFFDPEFKKLIWRDEQATTLYNFLPNQPVENMMDDHDKKHGTTVTALALNNIGDSSQYPRIMVLKALDKNKEGSSFSVSCAISYAIKHRAQIINASLGYTGEADSVLRWYLSKTNRAKRMVVFVAAGNSDGGRSPSMYCSQTIDPGNLITTGNLFYPACFSTSFNNIYAVTGLNASFKPCYYQKYSKEYVNLGVVNKVNCCMFKIPYYSQFYEGSSYSTPVAAGLMTGCLLRNQAVMQSARLDWENNYIKRNSSSFVRGGQYVQPINE